MKGSAKAEKVTYVCAECRYQAAKWLGFCPHCRSDKALIPQEAPVARPLARDISLVSATAPNASPHDRNPVGIQEFDRVLGGGVVPGAAILIGGEPGVGKSTLLLHVADALAGESGTVLMATAEESTAQVQLRARRIGVSSDGVSLCSLSDVDAIMSLASEIKPYAFIVDSIQTITSVDVSGSAGGVSQVRECAARLVSFAKRSGIPVMLVGHVTKDGSIAGPRMLEHMVDVVLYLEGEPDYGLRFLRGIKNRYGPAGEVGVFEMTQDGLVGVPDPSGLMVSHRNDSAPGTILFPTLEGKRPLVVEVQALVVPSEAPQPRRAVNGMASSRVHQILGVLERHLAIPLRSHEVYVSVMGGIKVSEPAADLPTALAVASAYFKVALHSTAAWGELGLTGEVRPVPRSTVRVAEAQRVGATPLVSPHGGVRHLMDALTMAGLHDRGR